mmetsp:Transcript_13126/g.29873  ORF Transcript_13126/g.29873 Transcript_13126/m.29873 type:complete len:237 (+) Transcript_13126:97-807(+)
MALAELRDKLQEQRKRIGDMWHDHDEHSFGRRYSVDHVRDRGLVSSRRQDTSSMLSVGGSDDTGNDEPPSEVSSFAKAEFEEKSLLVPEHSDASYAQNVLGKSSEPPATASSMASTAPTDDAGYDHIESHESHSTASKTASTTIEVPSILTPTTAGSPRSRSGEGSSARSLADTDSGARFLDEIALYSSARCQNSLGGEEEQSFFNYFFPCCFTRDKEVQVMPALGPAGIGLQPAS